MPRTAKSNRTDLLTPQVGPTGPGQPNGQQPISTPTGLAYGENQQLAQAQQAAPLPQAPTPGGSAPPGGSSDPIQAAKNFQMPNLGDLHGPTQRPNEPVTAGLPGAIGTPSPRQVGSLSSMISAVAQASGSAALSQLAARATSAGQ